MKRSQKFCFSGAVIIAYLLGIGSGISYLKDEPPAISQRSRIDSVNTDIVSSGRRAENAAPEKASREDTALVEARSKVNYTIVPSQILSSLKINLVGDDRKIDPKFMVTAGLSNSEVVALNNQIAAVDSELERLRRANMRVAEASNGQIKVIIPPLADSAAQLKTKLLETLSNSLDEDIKQFMLPQMDGRIDAQFGYFGRYQEEFLIRNLDGGIYNVNRRTVFDDKAHTIETTARFVNREELMAQFPGLGL